MLSHLRSAPAGARLKARPDVHTIGRWSSSRVRLTRSAPSAPRQKASQQVGPSGGTLGHQRVDDARRSGRPRGATSSVAAPRARTRRAPGRGRASSSAASSCVALLAQQHQALAAEPAAEPLLVAVDVLAQGGVARARRRAAGRAASASQIVAGPPCATSTDAPAPSAPAAGRAAAARAPSPKRGARAEPCWNDDAGRARAARSAQSSSQSTSRSKRWWSVPTTTSDGEHGLLRATSASARPSQDRPDHDRVAVERALLVPLHQHPVRERPAQPPGQGRASRAGRTPRGRRSGCPCSRPSTKKGTATPAPARHDDVGPVRPQEPQRR